MRTYQRLADTMAKHPAMQIFRRFSALNVKSILYYEAELAILAEELEAVEGEDEESHDLLKPRFGDLWLEIAYGGIDVNDDDRSSCNKQENQKDVEGAAGGVKDNDMQQWRLICRIRTVLNDYYRALEHQMDIENKCTQPRHRDLSKLREWHNDSRCGAKALARAVEDVWDSQEQEGIPQIPASSYIAAASTGDALSYLFGGWYLRTRDRLAAWKARRLPRTGGAEVGSSEKQQPAESVRSLDPDAALTVTKGILTMLASTLPVVPVVILYIIKSMAVRVGLVFVFTLVMSAAVTFGLSINAEKTIAITTAFAAVQVVFISTNSNAV